MDKDYYLIKTKKAIAKMPQHIINKTIHDYELEKTLWQCIENGDYEAFDKVKQSNVSTVIWKRPFYGEDCDRKLEQLSINEQYDLLNIFITTGERRAILAGVSPVEAMTLADIVRSDANSNRTIKNMTEISHAFAYSLSLLIKNVKESERGLVGKIKEYIKNNIYKKFTIETIAKNLNTNYNTLSTKFYKKTGIPLKQYILQEKCKEAKKLLIKTDSSLSDISEELGFSSQSHFQRVFKKTVGITPLEYRNTK